MAYSSLMDKAISYVRDNYSIDGIDVTSTSENFFVCSVPEKVEDIGGITENLESRYGCIVDFRRAKSGAGFEFVVNTPAASDREFSQEADEGAGLLAAMGRGACHRVSKFASQAVGAAMAAVAIWYFTRTGAARDPHLHAP